MNEANEPVENFIAKIYYQGSWGQAEDEQEPEVSAGGRVEIRDYAFWDTHLQYWQPKRIVWLTIKAPGFEDRSVEVQDELVRGQHNDIGDVVLTKSKAGDELCVRVLNADNTPVSNARIYQLTSKQARWYMTLAWDREELPQLEDWRVADTGVSGEVRMPTSNADLVAVQHPEYGLYTQAIVNVDGQEDECEPSKTREQEDSADSQPELSPITVTLHKAGRVVGIVIDRDGQPAGLHDVFIEPVDEDGDPLPGGFRVIERTELDGTFRFDRIHGRCQVGVRHPEEKWRPESLRPENERAIVLVDSEECDVSLAAWNVHDFTVEIREADRPVIGAKLKLMSKYCCTQDGEYYDTAWQGFTNEHGRYTFRQVAEGDVVWSLCSKTSGVESVGGWRISNLSRALGAPCRWF